AIAEERPSFSGRDDRSERGHPIPKRHRRIVATPTVTLRRMQPQGPRPFAKGLRSPIVAPITRGLLALPLFFFAASTRTSFAWTILPPLTAAILGANYFASAALAVFASRESLWANGRVSVTAARIRTDHHHRDLPAPAPLPHARV